MTHQWRETGNVLVWGTGRPGLSEPCTPKSIQAEGPGWNDDLASLEPWNECALIHEGRESRCWAGSNYSAGFTVFVCSRCTSSLDAAWHLDANGSLPAWSSVLAVRQTAGRGQLRRQWSSRPGNIHGALKMPPMEKEQAGLTSLIMGWLVAESLQDVGVEVHIKWPNDLLIDNRKVGGILIEERHCRVVAGVGINLTGEPEKEMIRERSAMKPGTLADFGFSFSPCRLWIKLVQKCELWYRSKLTKVTNTEIISRVQSRMAFMGSKVLVVGNGYSPVQGYVLGLSPEGGLRILLNQGKEMVLRSGSIIPLD